MFYTFVLQRYELKFILQTFTWDFFLFFLGEVMKGGTLCKEY